MDFKSIANKKLEDIVRPALPPIGTYTWQVTKLPAIETSKDQKWDFVTFFVQAVAPSDDIDPDELAAFGDITKIRESVKFIFDKQDEVAFLKSENRLKDFLQKHLKVGTDSDSMGQAMNAAVGAQFLGVLSWRPDKDNPDIMYTQLGKTSPIL